MAVNEKSKENLRPAAPGEVRNPGGRPKGSKNRATVIMELLKLKGKQKNPLRNNKEENMTVEKMIELALVKKALAGDVRAIQLVSEKVYGRMPMDINLGGQHDNPVVEKKIGELTFEQLYELKYKKPYQAPDPGGDQETG